ncbi:MAG: hypothetical protein WAM28_06925 [Chlamydiales bacterium]
MALELNNQTFAPVLDVQGNICRLIDPFSREVVKESDFTVFGDCFFILVT